MAIELIPSAEEIILQAKLTLQLSQLIDAGKTQKVITQAAEEAGIEVTTEELQAAADQFRLLHELGDVDATMAWLEHHYLTLDDFENLVELQLLKHKLVNYLFADQVEAWFVAHQVDYMSAAIYEVILEDEDLALELFYGLQEGELNFWQVAQQYIEDVELRRRGGYLGIIPRCEMRPEVSAQVFSCQKAQILKPIVTAQGVHLIWVVEVIQPSFTEELRNKAIEFLLRNWLNQKK